MPFWLTSQIVFDTRELLDPETAKCMTDNELKEKALVASVA